MCSKTHIKFYINIIRVKINYENYGEGIRAGRGGGDKGRRIEPGDSKI
jgi:hypothetical protein